MSITHKNSVLETASTLIKSAAKKYKVSPYDITSAQFWSVAHGKLSEWKIRKLGGFTSIRDLEFPLPPGKEVGILPRLTKIPKYKTPSLENFNVHNSNDTEFTPHIRNLFKLTKLKNDGVFRVLVQPDTHVPEHDVHAVNAFLKFAEWYRPHGYVNLGDFLENDSVSHWPARNPKPRRLVPEIECARELLKKIDKALGPQCVYKRFLIGNHEDFLDQMLVARVPEIVDGLDKLGVDLSVRGLLQLKDLGYRVVPLNEILRLGDLHFIHGFYTPMHHAKKHLDVFGCNLAYGHLHDVQSYTGVSVRGVHEAMSFGCLRSLNAAFMKGKPNSWSHCFGIVEYRIDGNYTRYAPIIVNGKFSFNGKMFDGTT